MYSWKLLKYSNLSLKGVTQYIWLYSVCVCVCVCVCVVRICCCCPRLMSFTKTLVLWQYLQKHFQGSFKRPFVSKPLKDLPLALTHRRAMALSSFQSADISRACHPSVSYRMNENGTVKMINHHFYTFLLNLHPFSSETSRSVLTASSTWFMYYLVCNV